MLTNHGYRAGGRDVTLGCPSVEQQVKRLWHSFLLKESNSCVARICPIRIDIREKIALWWSAVINPLVLDLNAKSLGVLDNYCPDFVPLSRVVAMHRGTLLFFADRNMTKERPHPLQRRHGARELGRPEDADAACEATARRQSGSSVG